MSNPFPDLPPDEYNALLADIEKRGIVYPIVLDQHGQIIDGHQRSHIAMTLNIAPPTKTLRVKDEAEREEFAIALNVHRRHLSAAEKRAWIIRMDPQETGLTQHEIARHIGVSQSTVSKVLAKARDDEIVITPDKYAGLPPSRAQIRSGKAGSTRGGRPSRRAETRKAVAAANKGHTPHWFNQFVKWCRRPLPEDRDYLIRMRDEIDRAIAILEEAAA